MTILTCIEKSEAYQQDKQFDRNDGNDDTNENQNLDELPIMSDLVCFKTILTDMQE